MTRTTNMPEIISCALRFLDMDLEFDDTDIASVIHPFWSECIVALDWPKISTKSRYLDIVSNPEALQEAKDVMREWILKCTSPLEIFQLFSRSYLFFTLNMFDKWLSTDDMSAVLRYVWQSSVYAANTSSLNKRELLRMLNACNPQILMDAADYAAYQALPDELTLYRGVHAHNRCLVKSFSWTLNPEIVEFAYSRRFSSCNGIAYMAKIRKKDVFAYFLNQSEVIVHPDKLYGIETYPVETD